MTVNKDIQSSGLRWIILLLVSIAIGTNYYVYDAMSSIKSVLQANLGFSNSEYGIIVAFYSIPNLFMTLIGGIILDKWGIRRTGALFISLCVGGAFLTAFGASELFQNGIFYNFFGSFITDFSPEFKIMVLGRLLFGLGAETSIVVINKVLVKWFKGKELALAFAINVAIARIGTAAALIFSPLLLEGSFGWTTPLWFAAIIMATGLVSFIIYIVTDARASGNASEQQSPEDAFKVSDIFNLVKNRSFIYVSALCVIFYSAVFPFLSYTPDMLYNKYNVSLEMSGRMSSFIIFGTIFFTPLFGYLADKVGKRASMMVLGSLLLFIVHALLALTNITPYVPMVLLGISFSLVPAAMWPSIALIVEEKRLGTAYGLMTAIQNIGLATFPILTGFVLDASNEGITQQMVADGVAKLSYTNAILVFAGLGLLGLIFSFLLKAAEKKHSHGLEAPSI